MGGAADGHLLVHNSRFSELWSLTEDELVDHPHFQDIARLCMSRIGPDEIWSIVSAGINAVEPERYGEWSQVRRGDGSYLSLSMSRLPNGDTAVTFTDLTQIDEFSAVLQEQPISHAAI
jgi:hypothetical protein